MYYECHLKRLIRNQRRKAIVGFAVELEKFEVNLIKCLMHMIMVTKLGAS